MHYFLTGVNNLLTIMALWGQKLWLAGAFAKLAFIGTWTGRYYCILLSRKNRVFKVSER